MSAQRVTVNPAPLQGILLFLLAALAGLALGTRVQAHPACGPLADWLADHLVSAIGPILSWGLWGHPSPHRALLDRRPAKAGRSALGARASSPCWWFSRSARRSPRAVARRSRRRRPRRAEGNSGAVGELDRSGRTPPRCRMGLLEDLPPGARGAKRSARGLGRAASERSARGRGRAVAGSGKVQRGETAKPGKEKAPVIPVRRSPSRDPRRRRKKKGMTTRRKRTSGLLVSPSRRSARGVRRPRRPPRRSARTR